LQNIVDDNVEDYRKQLMLVLREVAYSFETWKDVHSSETSIQYWTDTLQDMIDKGNENAQQRKKR